MKPFDLGWIFYVIEFNWHMSFLIEFPNITRYIDIM